MNVNNVYIDNENITLNKFDVFVIICFFSASPISKFLDLFGINRVISYSLLLLIIFMFLIKNLSKITIDMFLYYLLVTPLLVYGVYKNGIYITKVINIYSIFLVFYPAYLLFRIINIKEIVKGIRNSSYIILLFYLPQVFILDMNYQYMDFAYWTQLALCVVIYYAIKERKILDILLGGIGLICQVIFGSRGALVGIVAFIFYIYIKKINYRKVVLMIIGGVGFLYAYLQLDYIILWLSRYGISSRTLMKLYNREFTSSKARDLIYSNASNFINSKPQGYGVLGSRSLIMTYPHSYFYELMIDFGKYLGFVLFIMITLTAIYLLISCKSDDDILVSSLFCVLGLITLSVSGSFYYEYYFPIILALFFKFKKERKKRKVLIINTK